MSEVEKFNKKPQSITELIEQAKITARNELPKLHVERLFEVENPASIAVIDHSSNKHEPRRAADKLIYTYDELFGKRQALPDPEVEITRFKEGFEYYMEDKDRQFGEPGDSWMMKMIREKEARSMATILLKPPTDIQIIKLRQRLLGSLARSKDLDQMIESKNNSYCLLEGMFDFYADWDSSYSILHDINLVDYYRRGVQRIPVYKEYSNTDISDYHDVEKLVENAMGDIRKGVSSLRQIYEITAKSDNQVIRSSFSLIPDIIKKTLEHMRSQRVPLSREVDFGSDSNGSRHYRLKDLKEYLVEPSLLSIGVSLEWAKRIRDHGWNPVEFDPDKSIGYEGGWNIERDRSRQKRNGIAFDKSFIILSGANTSGKSHFMKGDLLIHMAAQATGFAPVKDGNFGEPADGFVYLDRTSSDPGQDLSAFYGEIRNWKEALSDIRPGMQYWVDEGFTTTSPEEGGKLLAASGKYIERKGGRVMVATHNETALDKAEQDPGIGLYNLKSDVSPAGKLVRHFKLQPGRADSGAIAVSRSEKLPVSFIEFTQKYVETKQLEIPTPPNPVYPDIEPYTPMEREFAKRQADSLEHLFPNTQDKPLLHLYSMNLPVSSVSYVKFTNKEVARMIFNTSELLPAQILERQQMFQELSKNDNWQNIDKTVQALGIFVDAVIEVNQNNATALNRSLHPFLKRDKANGADVGGQIEIRSKLGIEDINASIAYLKLNKKLLGEKFLFDVLLTQCEDYLASNPDPEKPLDERGKALIEEMRYTHESMPVQTWKDFRDKDLNEELETLGNINKDKKARSWDHSNDVEEMKREERHNGPWGRLYSAIKLRVHGLPYAIIEAQHGLKNLKNLQDTLNTYDSVYLNQFGNYIGQFTDTIIALMDGEHHGEKQQESDKMETAIFGYLGGSFSPRCIRRGLFGTEEQTPFEKGLSRLQALCNIAGAINEHGLQPVTFNNTGEVNLQNAWNIFDPVKDRQVPNPIQLGGKGERIQLLTGPNGSGKTYHEKTAIGAVMMAHSTGFAPAESATMPVFDGVLYMDRVTERQAERLSAGSQEQQYIKNLLTVLKRKKNVFAAIDELGSTTSSKYQEAFIHAVNAQFLSGNHQLMLALHHHGAVDKIEKTGTKLIKPYYFEFDVNPGEIVFHRKMREGHETSHAFDVAESAGLPIEIVNMAREMR